MKYAAFLFIGWAVYLVLSFVQMFFPYGASILAPSLVLIGVISITISFAFYCLLPFSVLFFIKRDSAYSLIAEVLALGVATVLIGFVSVGIGGLSTLVGGTTVYIRNGVPTAHFHIDNLVVVLATYIVASILHKWVWGRRATAG